MQTLFGRYLKSAPPAHSEVYELKICKANALPFSNVKDHQLDALLDSRWNGFYHKLTDPPMFYGAQTRFNVKRPFDCMFLKNVSAFVVIWYYKPRKPKVFLKIRISDFIAERQASTRKSLTEARATAIGQQISL